MHLTLLLNSSTSSNRLDFSFLSLCFSSLSSCWVEISFLSLCTLSSGVRAASFLKGENSLVSMKLYNVRCRCSSTLLESGEVAESEEAFTSDTKENISASDIIIKGENVAFA